MNKIKFLLIYLIVTVNGVSQNDSKIISFEILESRNNPLPGVSIYVKDSHPLIETQTDFDGKASLHLTNFKSIVVLSFLGPYYQFNLIEDIDFININFEKKRAVFYSKNKVIKKVKLKPDAL